MRRRLLIALLVLGGVPAALTRHALAADGYGVAWRVGVPATTVIQETTRSGTKAGADPGGDDVTVPIFSFEIISGTELGQKSGLASGVYRADRIHRISAVQDYLGGAEFSAEVARFINLVVSATPWARNLTVTGTRRGFTATVDMPNHIFNEAGELVRDGPLIQPSQVTFSWRIGPEPGSSFTYGSAGSGAGATINLVGQTGDLGLNQSADVPVALPLPGYSGGLLSLQSGSALIAAAPSFAGSVDADNHPGIVSTVVSAALSEAAGAVAGTVRLQDRALVDGQQLAVGALAPVVPGRTLTFPFTHPAALASEFGLTRVVVEASEDAAFTTLRGVSDRPDAVLPPVALPDLPEGVTQYWRVRVAYPTGATTQRTSAGSFVVDEHPPQQRTEAWRGVEFSAAGFITSGTVVGGAGPSVLLGSELVPGQVLARAIDPAQDGFLVASAMSAAARQSFTIPTPGPGRVRQTAVMLQKVAGAVGWFFVVQIHADNGTGLPGALQAAVVFRSGVLTSTGSMIGVDWDGLPTVAGTAVPGPLGEPGGRVQVDSNDLTGPGPWRVALGGVAGPVNLPAGRSWIVLRFPNIVELGAVTGDQPNPDRPAWLIYPFNVSSDGEYFDSRPEPDADARYEVLGDKQLLVTQGVYTSAPRDMGGPVIVARLDAATTVPADGSVGLQVETSPDAITWTAPQPPTPVPPGTMLAAAVPTPRWVRWRATLTPTADRTRTPEVRQGVVGLREERLAGVTPADGAPQVSVQPAFTWPPAFDNVALDRYEVRVDTQPAQTVPAGGPLQVAAAVDFGSHTWTLAAVDRAGNRHEETRTFAVPRFDPLVPALLTPAAGAFAGVPVAFQWTGIFAGRGLARYELLLDGATSAVDPGSPSTARPLAEGFHTWTVRAVDAAGAVTGAPPAQGVFVDTTPPAVAVDVTALVMDTAPVVTVQIVESTSGSGLTAQNLAAATWRLESPTLSDLSQHEGPGALGIPFTVLEQQTFATIQSSAALLADGTTQALAATLQTPPLPDALLSLSDVTVVVRVGDRAGNVRETRVRLPTPRVGPVRAAPAAFSPNGDGLLDVTTVSYAARLARPTQVQIVNSASVTVRGGLEDARIIRESFTTGLGSVSVVAGGGWSATEQPGRLTTHEPWTGTFTPQPVALAQVGTTHYAELTLSATVGMDLLDSARFELPEQWVGYWLGGAAVPAGSAALDAGDVRLQQGIFVRIFQPALFSGTLFVQAFGLDVQAGGGTGTFTKILEAPLLLSETTVQTSLGPTGTVLSIRVPLRVTLAGDELLIRANGRVSLALDLASFHLTTGPVYLAASVPDGQFPNRAVFDDVVLTPVQAAVAWDGRQGSSTGPVVADGAYTLRVTTGPGGSVLASTSVVVDVTPPTAVTALTATARPAGNIDLAWSAAVDTGTGFAFYEVLRATHSLPSVAITTTSAQTYVDAGASLTHNTTYYYRVRAVDQVAIRGGSSPVAVAQSDREPPGAILDLAAVPELQVRLVWSQVGDDGMSGGAPTRFLVRYATTPIVTDSDFLGATAVSTPPHPLPPGFPQVGIQVTGLRPRTTYYFAVRAEDEVGNVGALSNTAGNSALAGSFRFAQSLVGTSDGAVGWADLDNDGDLDLVVLGDRGTNMREFNVYRNDSGTLVFWRQLSPPFPSDFAFGDLDQDGNIDLLTAQPVTFYRNTGTGLPTSGSATNLPAGVGGYIALGDADNDGDLDVALIGTQFLAPVFFKEVDLKTDTTSFVQFQVFSGSGIAKPVWADFNRDGRLDLALLVDLGSGSRLHLYRNDGAQFSLVQDLPGVTGGGLAVGDMNNDGWVDLVMAGFDSVASTAVVRVLQNATGLLTVVQSVPGVRGGRIGIALGDYDNDGNLDIVVNGADAAGTGRTTLMYRNDSGTLTADPAQRLPKFGGGGSSWADIDGDGDLDLVMTGINDATGNPETLILKSLEADFRVPNSTPVAPSTGVAVGFSSATRTLELTWAAGSDVETPTNGLYYSVRVGTGASGTAAANSVVSGAYGSPLLGNYLRPTLSTSTLGIRITVQPETTYYWAVRTIDAGLRASAESVEQVVPASQTAVPPAAPTGVTVVSRTAGSPAAVTLAWVAPGDDGTVGAIVGGEWNVQWATVTPVASTDVFGSTSVTPGTTMQVTLAGLPEGTTVYFKVRMRDELAGNFGPFSAEVSTRTLRGVTVSSAATTLHVTYEVMRDSSNNEVALSVTVLSTAAAPAAFALQVATAAGLATITPFFDLQPASGSFQPSAVAVFTYPPDSQLPAGTTEADLAVYRFDGVSWSSASVPILARDLAANTLTVAIASTSLWAVMAPVDHTPPITRLVQVGDAVQVVAEDPAGGFFVSGVATTTIVLDRGPVQVVATPFVVPAGTRFISLQSVDRAGNQEVAHRHVAFPVTAVRATAGAQTVHLLWRDPTSAGDFLGDAQEYDVERATDVGGQPGTFVGQVSAGDLLSLPRWADRGLTGGTTYWYRILTQRNEITGGGFQGTFTSIPSAPVRATPAEDRAAPGVEGLSVSPSTFTTLTSAPVVQFRLTEAATWQLTVTDPSGTVVRTLVARGFTDDFGDGQDEGWTVPSGVWTVDRDGYHGYARGAGTSREELAVTTVDHFDDLVYETTVTIHPRAIPTDDVELIFRVQAASAAAAGLGRTFYGFALDATPPAVRAPQFTGFTKQVDGRPQPLAVIRSSAVVLEGGRGYAVRVEARHGTLRGFVDGVLVQEVVDAAPLGPGRVGLRIQTEEAPGAAAFGPVRVLAAGSTLAWDGLTDAGLVAPDGRYTVSLAAADVFGNRTTRSLSEILLDRHPPTPVSDLTAVGQAGGAIRLAWSPATDEASGVSGYGVRRATAADLLAAVEAALATVAAPGFLDGPAGLTHNTTYFYVIQPEDGVGQVQTAGNLVASAVSDQVAPAVVTDLVARFQGPNPGELTLTWTSPGDDGTVGVLAGRMEIHLSPTLPVTSEVIAFTTVTAPGATVRVVVTGLAEGVTHYVAVRTVDEVGNAAALSAPVHARYVVARSTDGVATLISDQDAMTMLTTSTATAATLGQVALSTGLVPVSTVYDIQPDTAPFTPPLVVTLVYSTPLPTGVVESDLKIYQFNSSSNVWVAVPDQTLDTANRRVIGRIVTLTSMVAIFGIDRIPPTARLLVPDPAAAGAGRVVTGTLAVVGSVADDRRLAGWRVEVATGVTAAGGFVTILTGTAPVDGAGLGLWDTVRTPGWVTLRLTATDTAGNAASTVAVVFVGDPALVQTVGPGLPELVDDRKPDTLHHPEAVAVGPDGTRWVADSGENRVLAFRADGTLRLVVGQMDEDVRVASGVVVVPVRLKEPGGLATLAEGGVVVADTGQHRLVVISSTGAVRQIIGRAAKHGEPQPGRGAAEFNHPRGVDVDAAGNLYVADTENHRWQVLSATGTALLTVALPRVPERDEGDDVARATSRSPEEDAEPIGIVRERMGNRVYVSERESGQVFVYVLDLAASTATLTGTLGGGPGTFQAPWHLAGTAQGDLYVAERNAGRVRRFDRFGAETLAFGAGPKATGVGVGPNGELAVAVRQDDRVKVYDAPAAAPVVGAASSPPKAAPRPAQDLSALGPPHDFAMGPNPVRNGAPLNVYFVTGWSNFETEVRMYTVTGEAIETEGRPEGRPLRTTAVPWSSAAYAPGRYAVTWAPRNESGETLASGVYIIQIKVRNPETGEVVPTLKKVMVIR